MDKLIEKLKNRKVLLCISAVVAVAVLAVIAMIGSGKPSPDGPSVVSVSGPGFESTQPYAPPGPDDSPVTPSQGEAGISSVSGNDALTEDFYSGEQDGTGSGNSDVSGNIDENGTDELFFLPEPAESTVSIDDYIAAMTLHEKVCQMIIATPASLTGEKKPKSAGDLMQNALTAYPVGGLIFDGGNISSSDQLRKFLSDAQSFSQIPLFLTLDEEGGRVTRLQNTVGTTQIGPMYDYHELGTGVAYTNAMIIASDIRSYGFNLDLAPVADVWSNPANTVIGDRAYSTDFIEASELIPAAVQGFHSQGIPCCLKHFPGHGDSSEDSHYGAVYIYKSLADIKAEECLPFASGIDAGADCVMMGHLIIDELGDEPALFSQTLIRGVLRGELGFDGIVMTDSLQMKAMTDHYGVSDIAVRSVSAGCDILLMPSDVPFTVKAIEDAVAEGTVSESRIDESVRRIIMLKLRYGIMEL